MTTPDPRRPRPGPVAQHEERRDGEDERPQPAQQHRDPDVQAVGVRDAEEPDVGLDEEEVQGEQDEDAAEVPHPPAEARDPPHRPRRRHLVDRRVVVDTRDLRDDRPDAEQHQPHPQVRGLRLDDVQRGREPGEEPGLQPQVADGAPGAVRVLAEHGSQQRHEQPRDGRGDRQGRGRGVGRPEALARDVHREDERRDDGVERLGAPVPHPPGEDAPPGARARGVEGGRASGVCLGRDRRCRHPANASEVRPAWECATREMGSRTQRVSSHLMGRTGRSTSVRALTPNPVHALPRSEQPPSAGRWTR